ncbi:MAG: LLM class flavin-dependent oxidoreductase [Acetobacteraceae bacterium]|nr:LLM class flavin-dependent oxidoreductase [Acetobacteraceae bacterium]
MRQMTLVGFLQAQNCSNFVGSWRHPQAAPDFASAEYYRRIGRVLEAGKFHLGFFDDRLAMPDLFGGDHAHTVANGIRCVKMDPVTILTVMGMATQRLGLGATFSTTYYEPFHVARVFATLDLMTEGRAAWNIVTSMNDGEAFNMGATGHGEHDRRYDRADEFLEVVHGHWDSWEDGAIVADRETGLFAHPEKVHRLDHHGTFFNSRGPFTVPRSAQGHPVLIQAGQSGRGQRFAARWAELVFVAYYDLERAKIDYASFKQQVAAAGRDPDKTFVCAGVYPIVAETRSEAEDKAALIDSLPKEIDSLSLLSEVLNYDFSKQPIDQPFTEEELASWTGVQGMRDRIRRLLGGRLPTPRDFIEITHRGTAYDHPRFVGTARDVADGLEEWFVGRGCDGFVVAATHVPGAYEEFVQFVVPELQRRGLYHKDYAGTTLRENLGLARPDTGDWKHAR